MQRRRADAGPGDSRSGHEVGSHRERGGVPVPARQRLVELLQVALRDVDEGRGSRATVEVLVPAADGEVGPVLVEPDVEHPGGVAEVPAGQRPHRVRRPRDLGEVPQLTRAVVHRGVGREHEVLTHLGDAGDHVGGGDPLDDEAGVARRGIRDVEVGGEGVGVGEDDPPARAHPGGRDDRLVEVDRRGVGAHDLAGRRPDEGADAVADPGGGLPPAGVVPARDEVVAPLAVHDVGDDLGDAGRQGAEGVAVEVDDPGREPEAAAQVGGRVEGVELAGSFGQR